MNQAPSSRSRPAGPQRPPEPPGGSEGLSFPAGLLLAAIALQLVLLAWSAFPADMMKGEQPLESWFFLAGGQAVLFSWLWPVVRIGSRAGTGSGGELGEAAALRPWRQAALEGGLLAASAVAPAVAAVWWVDASAGQVVAAAVYLLLWLGAGGLAVGLFARAGSPGGCPGRRVAAWVFAAATTLGNFGLFGLAYLSEDFRGGDPAPLLRISPMAQAGRLTDLGWPGAFIEQLAFIVPAMACLLLALAAILLRTPTPPPVPNRRLQ